METEKIATTLIEAHERGHRAAIFTDEQMIQVKDQDGRVFEPFPICGFAWVRVKGLRGKKLKEFQKRGFDKCFSGGQMLFVNDYDQSHDRKAAYAREYAKTLQENGFDAWSESRLD
jgi:hypothetical protein